MVQRKAQLLRLTGGFSSQSSIRTELWRWCQTQILQDFPSKWSCQNCFKIPPSCPINPLHNSFSHTDVTNSLTHSSADRRWLWKLSPAQNTKLPAGSKFPQALSSPGVYQRSGQHQAKQGRKRFTWHRLADGGGYNKKQSFVAEIFLYQTVLLCSLYLL